MSETSGGSSSSKNFEKQAAVLSEVTALQTFLIENRTMDEVLAEIAQTAARLFPNASAAISLFQKIGSERALRLSTWTDERARITGQATIEQGKGPAFDALKSGEPIISADLSVDERWPDLGYPAISVLSMPMTGRDGSYGTVCLYGDVGAAKDLDLDMTALLARQCSALLDNVVSYQASRTSSENLLHAMESRAEIEQAKGMIMLLQHVDADGAFDVLRTISQQQNKKLRTVAIEVLQRRSLTNAADAG